MRRLGSIALLLGVACAASPAMRAAERGDRDALANAIGARERAGDLSTSEAAGLARIVADRELRGATGTDPVVRVKTAAPCARELDDALAARMATHDEAGALAALERIESGDLGVDGARPHLRDADGPWRAVGARGLVKADDRAAREGALVDADPRVRRQAARAAGVAGDPADATALLEAIRLDPEPLVRTEAVRALRRLPRIEGDVVGALRDLWPRADDSVREDIAIAWAAPALWGAGGREALLALIASGHGPGVVEGALAVLRLRSGDTEVDRAALEQVARSIASGPRERRLQAIAGAPLDRAELLAAVKGAGTDTDLLVRVGALGRLAEAREPGARADLVALASPGSRVAARARFALAALGDRSVQAWVEQDLSSTEAAERLGAATSLAEMRVPARAAPLLADPDADVRLRAACTLVLAARRN
jgi:HEAT repeat protein